MSALLSDPNIDQFEQTIPVLRSEGGGHWGLLYLSVPVSGRKHAFSLPPLQMSPPERSELPSTPELWALEEVEYIYHLQPDGGVNTAIATSHPDVFRPDDSTGLVGRFRPGARVGTLTVDIAQNDERVGRFSLEVRSRKLNYIEEFRWMLDDIAECFIEFIMQRFAPTERTFGSDPEGVTKGLYQRFALLRTFLFSEAFDQAVQILQISPHNILRDDDEHQSSSVGFPTTSRALRALSMPGPRVLWEASPVPELSYIPAHVPAPRANIIVDTPENRLIRFALERWREVIAEVEEACGQLDMTAAIERGLLDAKLLGGKLDAILSTYPLEEAGPLGHVPWASQVLQKRPGYRELFRAFQNFETLALLDWELCDDVFAAGQRDVAALYEYWAFIVLARIISERSSVPFDLSELVTHGSGLSVNLQRGNIRSFEAKAVIGDRELSLQLFFNKQFAGGDPSGSWTRSMRPDASLRIGAASSPLDGDMWIHFDSKYKFEGVNVDLEEESVANDSEQETSRRAKRDDLLKMHAYRDAIRGSAGVYVLFPGTELEERRLYDEILPGLGAFVLRPVGNGIAIGASEVGVFIDEILTHAASAFTLHERHRFWTEQIYTKGKGPLPTGGLDRKPPADISVIVLRTESADHAEWIVQNGVCDFANDPITGELSAGVYAVAADFILVLADSSCDLWAVRSGSSIASQEQLTRMQHPTPRHCLLVPVEHNESQLPEWVHLRANECLRDESDRAKTPVTVCYRTWEELFAP